MLDVLGVWPQQQSSVIKAFQSPSGSVRMERFSGPFPPIDGASAYRALCLRRTTHVGDLGHKLISLILSDLSLTAAVCRRLGLIQRPV